jgi:hypothetical protein
MERSTIATTPLLSWRRPEARITGMQRVLNSCPRRSVIALARVAACVGALAMVLGCSTETTAEPQRPNVSESVSGSGLVDLRNDVGPGMPGSFVFQNKISAVRDTNGKVGGTIEGIVSLGDEATSAVAPNEGYRFKGVVTCLVVDGQNAWIGATITETNSSLVRQGDRWLGLVRDRGSSGADVSYAQRGNTRRKSGYLPCSTATE